jgi:hypothetical protein
MSNPNVFGTPLHKALYKELDELHSYDRLHIQLFMGWFAFFSTINIAALGWIATADPKPLIRACIALNFLTQSVLAILACRAVRKAFEKSGQRIEVILQQIDLTRRARSPLPLELYKKTNQMVASGCAILSVLWMVILTSMLFSSASQARPTLDTATDSTKAPTSFRGAPSAGEGGGGGGSGGIYDANGA